MRCLPLVCLAIAASACGAEDELHHPLDFEPVDDGKGDGATSAFDKNRLVPDEAFYDVGAMTAAEVQTFFEQTPYELRSFLADHRLADGRTVSAALHATAVSRGISPIILLVTLQKEAGLISRKSPPSRHRVDFAFGCGCPTSTCSERWRGLDKQLECAADRFAEYTADMVADGATISGWGPGITRRTNDGHSVTPSNRATAALYTYTPLVLRGTGGNWLFWTVWRRYALHLDYAVQFPFNEGWIGGNCSSDSDCTYDGGRCIFAEPGRLGTCTQSCQRTCPDRAGNALTFCVGETQGFCLARCDFNASVTGCAENQECVPAERNMEPGTVEDVCMPLAP
jgi:hypothetical protein